VDTTSEVDLDVIRLLLTIVSLDKVTTAYVAPVVAPQTTSSSTANTMANLAAHQTQ
jgi:hypothetical protein